MKISNPLFVSSVMGLFCLTQARRRSCKTYYIDRAAFLGGTEVQRGARIDSLSEGKRCQDITAIAGGALGATFCVGDNFDTTAMPFYEDEGLNHEVGFWSRAGTRVPSEKVGRWGNAWGTFYFGDYSPNPFEDVGGFDQIMFQSIDQAGSPLLTSAIIGGTGIYEGAYGTITFEGVFGEAPTVPTTICVVKQRVLSPINDNDDAGGSESEE